MTTPASNVPALSQSPYRFWLHALALLLVLGTFILVGVGGSVTSHDAGMAVPDWPGTFGYNMFLAPLDVWFRDPETGQYFHGRFWEHSHRLIGSAVGMLTIVLAVALWVTQRPSRQWMRWLGLALLGAVIIQGLMGGFRVTENSPLLAGIHGVFGQMVFAVTVLVAAALSRTWISRTAPLASHAPADSANRRLLRWEIIVLPMTVLVGLAASILLGGGDGEEDLIVWSVSDVGLIWIACLTVYMGICLWRLSRSLCALGAEPTSATETSRGAYFASIALLVMLMVQLILGAAVRHAGAERAIPDAPLAYGSVLPPMSDRGFELAVAGLPQQVPLPPPATTLADVHLHWTHRAWAVLVAFAVVGVVLSVWRRRHQLDLPLVLSPVMLVIAVTFLQIMLGIMTVWSEIHPTMATYHQATGAALLGVTTWLVVRTRLAGTGTAAPGPDTPHANITDSGYNAATVQGRPA